MAPDLMRFALTLLVVILLAGCSSEGGGSEPVMRSTATPDQTTALEKCGGGEGAGGWGGSVAGLSCEAAGKLIYDKFIGSFQDKVLSHWRYGKAAMEKAKPGTFTSAGFRCHHDAYSDEEGWVMQCEGEGQAVAFHLTP